MSGEPVRLLIASPDPSVVAGLSALLAGHHDRVLVVAEGAADVVLHDGDRAGGGDLDELMHDSGAVAWVPLRGGADRIVTMVERAATGPTPSALPGLSDREAEMLRLIVAGLTNREIAEEIFISINSVKTYIRSAYRKIGVNSRSQAVVWGLRNGIDRHSDRV